MKQYSYTINGAAYDVQIESIKGSVAKVKVNGLDFDVQIHGSLTEGDLAQNPLSPSDSSPLMGSNTQSASVSLPLKGEVAQSAGGGSERGSAGAGTPVKAPLPGVVTKVLVQQGQAVKKGDTVLVLEAMKMENNIQAEQDGTVTGICCAPGDSVMEGTTLITIG